MMGSWRRRRQGGEIHDQEAYRVRSDNRRSSQEIWQSTVPSWEKKFCLSVGSFPWHKFLETKRYIHMYGNILEWDDSAGKEAFNNAKSRFWAKINHLPCDILLPDPNIHIDAVDWDAAIEPELYLDLEKKPPPSEEDSIIQEEKSVFLSEALFLDPTFSCTGWGDAEDPKPNCENQAIRDQSGWGDYSNEWGNNLNQQGGNYYEGSRNTDGRGGFGTNTRWRNDGSGWINSRYKASRFAANEYQADRGHRGRRKKANVAHDKHPLRQWNMKPCAPVS